MSWEKRFKMWIENPNCIWCNKPTTFYMRNGHYLDYSDTEATIEHIDSKMKTPKGEQKEQAIACRKCNNERGKLEHELPRLQAIWIKDGRKGKSPYDRNRDKITKYKIKI